MHDKITTVVNRDFMGETILFLICLDGFFSLLRGSDIFGKIKKFVGTLMERVLPPVSPLLYFLLSFPKYN